jgi:hypothetical protein
MGWPAAQEIRTMPSPFPGMDPYLEAPDIWPDCDNAMAGEIRSALNRDLPSPYYARLEMRPEVGIVDDESGVRGRIVPDVTVVRRPRGGAMGAAAVATPTRREMSESFDVEFLDEAIHHDFVEIRDASRDHRLVTLIEILSPSNRRPGPDRDAYARKQREVLESQTSLVEIDLLRDGRRVLPDPRLARHIEERSPRPGYVVLVSPAWRRGGEGLGYRVYPFGLRDCLPCVGIPLKAEEPLLPLDLQHVFDRVYDDGPYRRGAVDYTKPPDPPLDGDDAAWAEALLREPAGP